MAMTKSEKTVWNYAKRIYSTEHNPHDTATLTNVWRGWFDGDFGWWADVYTTSGTVTKWLGKNIASVKEHVEHKEFMRQREMLMLGKRDES